MEIKWAQEALKDLDRIQDYISDDDEDIYIKIVFYILDKIEFSIRKYTHIGRTGRIFGTRELVLSQYPYIIVYTIKGNCLYIVRILHASMKYPK